MKLTFSGKHTAFILIGFFLCMASVLCSSFDSVIYSSFNGWTGEGSYGTSNFMTDIILWTGIFEVLLLFFQRPFWRIVSVLISITKLALPWFLFTALNAIGAASMDASFSYEIYNALPYVTSVFSALSILNGIVMAVVLIRERRMALRSYITDNCSGEAIPPSPEQDTKISF